MKKRPGLTVVIDEAIPFIRGIPESVADVSYMAGKSILRKDVELADALIIRTRTICNRSLLEGTRVSFIATATIGFDHLDVRYCRLKGIEWKSAPGCNSGSVMQYIVSALLHLCVRHGLEPATLTLGVVGAGHVGSKVAAAAKALGMKVLINDPPRQRREKPGLGFTRLGHLLKESDIVTLHVPLTMRGRDATFHLAGKDFIGAMKRNSFLINTSRGGITDEEAVKEALWSGHLRSYIADVWSGEPAADAELIEMAYLATPHIAGYSADGKLNGTRMVLSALSDHFSIPITLPDESLLPVPMNKIISLSDKEPDVTGALYQMVKNTYDIEAESNRFKSNPEAFEDLRNYYPVRREFQAYTISGTHPARPIAAALGFKTL